MLRREGGSEPRGEQLAQDPRCDALGEESMSTAVAIQLRNEAKCGAKRGAHGEKTKKGGFDNAGTSHGEGVSVARDQSKMEQSRLLFAHTGVRTKEGEGTLGVAAARCYEGERRGGLRERGTSKGGWGQVLG